MAIISTAIAGFKALSTGKKIASLVGGAVVVGLIGLAIITFINTAFDRAEGKGEFKAANESQGRVIENVGKAKNANTTPDAERDERLSGEHNRGPAKR